MPFKLTYSTMFDPPQELHEQFEASLDAVRNSFGRDYAHYIGGTDVSAGTMIEDISPIDTSLVLGRFPVATGENINAAVAAAKAAFPAWKNTPAEERNALLRRVGEIIEERVYDIAVVAALEVGKNRMEALGEIQETADFFYCYCDDWEKQRGFDHELPDDPLPDYRSHNRSIMKPYGPWAVIAPFNFPFALAGGPTAAALVTGNTVVLKAAPDTPWSVRLLADCIRDAGLPKGVFNMLTDPDDSAGPLLVDHADIAGVTFTGSHEVGMQINAKLAGGSYPRPCIAEMGGKNACIVTANADLERAALGIMRSAFGLSGQKCSALSRVYVDATIADDLIKRLQAAVDRIATGDPTLAANYMGPVANANAYRNFREFTAQLKDAGARIVCGGDVLADGDEARGFYCAPTVVEADLTHPLWQKEMFLPIVMVARVSDKETAMELVNDSPLG